MVHKIDGDKCKKVIEKCLAKCKTTTKRTKIKENTVVIINIIAIIVVVLASVSVILEITYMISNWSWLPLARKGE